MKWFKYIAVVIFAFSLHITSYGQFVPRDDNAKAMYFLQQNEIDSAKKYIDKAIENPELNNKQITWYYRGYIYKALYKKYEKNDKHSALRETAVESLKKAIELNDELKITESAKKILDNIAKSYFNDAAIAVMQDLDGQSAVKNFDKYKTLTLYLYPEKDLTGKIIEFKMALATMYNNINKQDTAFSNQTADKAIQLYEEVLALDSNNAEAYYNIGITYYNKAADIINNIDYSEDLMVVNKKLDQCVDLFLKALPYMHKAYDLNWHKEETLQGLAGIYYGLNDLEKYNYYKQKLDELQGQQKE